MADTASPGPSGERRIGAVFYIAVLLALAFLIALGSWQVQRLQWKEGLLAEIDERLQAAPVALEPALEQWRDRADVDYLPVRLEGEFRHADEQHYLATHKGQSGWYVYTPLALADGRSIIINRGFVPYDLKQAADRPWAPVSGAVSFHGLARNPLFDKPGWLLPDNTPADRTWYWKDHAAMAKAMGLPTDDTIPFFVDLTAYDDPTVEAPVGGVTRVALPNNHLQYAITWFGLAAALVIVAGYVVWRTKQTRNG